MSVDPNVLTPRVAGLALKEHDALPAGTRFGEFEIIRALGVGGFGIVYLAQDHSLERQVALKEYMPAALASRGSGPMIAVRASSFAETYAMGLRSFINEARLLARFDHPSLVKVYRFWEDNGTAYMVMPYLQGRTLRDARRALAQAPDEAWIRAVLDPMLDALELLHREGVFHRDVAPDNILLPPEGPPILLDFGAARRVISDRNDNLTAIIKPSYAPIEQYAEMATMRQGPWTDLYALGAVLHFLVFGSPPAPATARVVEAEVEPIAGRAVPGISPQFMRVMAWMLGVRPLERPQNVGAVRAALAGRIEPPEAVRHETTRPMVAQAVPSPFDATTFDAAYAPTLVAGRPTPASELPASPETARGLATGAAQSPLGAESGGGGAPMRSTPPGAPPPAYVPRPRPMSPPETVAEPLAPDAPLPVLEDVVAAPSRPDPALAVARGGRLRHRAVAGRVGAAVLGAAMLWQFAGLLGRPAGTQATPLSANALRAAGPGGAGATPSAPVASTPSPQDPGVVAVSPGVAAQGTAAPAPPGIGPAPLVADASGAPSPKPAIHAAPKTTQAHPSRPAAPARPQHWAAAQPATAREACGTRTFLSLAMCLDRQCERPRFRSEPSCARMLEARRRRAGDY